MRRAYLESVVAVESSTIQKVRDINDRYTRETGIEHFTDIVPIPEAIVVLTWVDAKYVESGEYTAKMTELVFDGLGKLFDRMDEAGVESLMDAPEGAEARAMAEKFFRRQ